MKYRVAPYALYKLGGEVDNIIGSHNYLENHGQKRNSNEIKRLKESKATIRNVV